MVRLRRLSLATLLPLILVCSAFQTKAAPSSNSGTTSLPVPNQGSPDAVANSKVQGPDSAYTYPDHQSFTYSVDWRLLNAGTTTLHLDTVNGERHIVATADSTGAVALLYHVHDRLEAFFHPQTNCALSLTKQTEEGFRRVDTKVRYDYQRKKAVVDEHNLRAKNQKHEEIDIPSCVTNTLTAAYYVASQSLQPGAKFIFPSSDGGKATDIEVTIEGREQVKTPLGNYNTVRISAEALNGPQKGKGKIWMWYTDDARRIPVQMRARAFWGTMLFHLTQMTPASQQRASQ